MLCESLTVSKAQFEAGTGWDLKPQGACRGEICIPLTDPGAETVDLQSMAEQMNMPLVADAEHGLWALGPYAGGSRTLTTAEAPELTLPDLDGNEFTLSSLRGQKVLMIAWSPY